MSDYSVSILADATAQTAFDCINNVTAWWTSDLKGQSQNMNDSFTVYFGDVHISTQKLVKLIPNQKVEWLVTDCAIRFVDDPKEWKDSRILFDIISAGDQTEIRFTHMGLNASLACYNACSNAWASYIVESLLPLIHTGHGKPSGKDL